MYKALIHFHSLSLLKKKKNANFLSSIDEKIDNLQKELDELKAYKKGIIQAIFSQESENLMVEGFRVWCLKMP